MTALPQAQLDDLQAQAVDLRNALLDALHWAADEEPGEVARWKALYGQADALAYNLGCPDPLRRSRVGGGGPCDRSVPLADVLAALTSPEADDACYEARSRPGYMLPTHDEYTDERFALAAFLRTRFNGGEAA